MNRRLVRNSPAVLALALIGVGGCKPTPPEPVVTESPEEQTARSYVTSFFASDTKALGRVEDGTMKASMTKETVAKTLSILKQSQGSLKNQGAVRNGTLQGFKVVYIPCNFEQSTLDAKVVFDKSNKVTGFSFVASGAQ